MEILALLFRIITNNFEDNALSISTLWITFSLWKRKYAACTTKCAISGTDS